MVAKTSTSRGLSLTRDSIMGLMDVRRRWRFQTTTLNLSSPSSLSNDQRTKISNCEAIFSNGSIWLLGRRHRELGPVVGGCPGLPHGKARPGRACLTGLAAAPAGAKGQLLCTGQGALRQKGPKRQNRPGGSGEDWMFPSPVCASHLHASASWPRPLKPAPTGAQSPGVADAERTLRSL